MARERGGILPPHEPFREVLLVATVVVLDVQMFVDFPNLPNCAKGINQDD